ncbi:RtcB family protein [Sphingobacterium spiritivorum]|uniref:RtcB family protein n=1 Tax=Sphingobacterium spiritivorum TaxID=258 RepID=UPI003DA5366F
MTQRINGNDLLALGYKENYSLGIALKINKKRVGLSREEMLSRYKEILEDPQSFLNDPIFSPLAQVLIDENSQPADATIPLNEDSKDYKIYGSEQIEDGAKHQMNIAMKLPVTVAGALMPDAHQGYGLPIGGVLAVKNAVIPYGVGVDIGCRMALSVYDIPADRLTENKEIFQKAVLDNSRFGAGHGFLKYQRSEHAVLDNILFDEHPLISTLKDKAWSQLGTSGGGNHFVEFGIIEFKEADKTLGIQAGNYVALLTHSGSRGLGATIAGHYTKIAKELCKLPYSASNLAYLDLNSEAGQEYWLAMNLAGDYASACHEIIHTKMAEALGATVLAKVENHHNFAWKEKWHEEEVIVHRKGATPAGKEVLGIIPGSMTAPGFLVRGKGEQDAINSASHGAGRQMSRTQAIKTLSKKAWKQMLEDHGVTLLGAGMDEAPMAYKNIHTVMEAQTDLIDVLATFSPKIVRMADDGSRED